MTATAPTIEDVIKRYRQLYAEKAMLAARHAEEMKPITEKLDTIEVYLLKKMNEEGVQSFKTEYGTAYQSRLTSVKMDDPIAFRNFVLAPAVDRILDTVIAMGANGVDKARDLPAMLDLVGTLGLWDLADFRPGKKGITKHQEETQKPVPGVSLAQIVNVNVKGS